MSVSSVVILSVAQRIGDQGISPKMSDMMLRELGASSILVTALCSKILSLLWHQAEKPAITAPVTEAWAQLASTWAGFHS